MQKQWDVKTEIACDSKIALLDHKVLELEVKILNQRDVS